LRPWYLISAAVNIARYIIYVQIDLRCKKNTWSKAKLKELGTAEEKQEK